MRPVGWMAPALVGLAITGLVAAGHGRSDEPQSRVNSESVLEHHKGATRDGHYVDRAFTRTAAARLHRDATFHAPLRGPTYAQPLYWAASTPAEKDLLLVANEQNEVAALDASTGAPIWRRSLGPPVPLRHLPCGNIDPLGITCAPSAR